MADEKTYVKEFYKISRKVPMDRVQALFMAKIADELKRSNDIFERLFEKEIKKED